MWDVQPEEDFLQLLWVLHKQASLALCAVSVDQILA